MKISDIPKELILEIKDKIMKDINITCHCEACGETLPSQITNRDNCADWFTVDISPCDCKLESYLEETFIGNPELEQLCFIHNLDYKSVKRFLELQERS